MVAKDKALSPVVRLKLGVQIIHSVYTYSEEWNINELKLPILRKRSLFMVTETASDDCEDTKKHRKYYGIVPMKAWYDYYHDFNEHLQLTDLGDTMGTICLETGYLPAVALCAYHKEHMVDAYVSFLCLNSSELDKKSEQYGEDQVMEAVKANLWPLLERMRQTTLKLDHEDECGIEIGKGWKYAPESWSEKFPEEIEFSVAQLPINFKNVG